jgi:DNA-binding PadR family transcriptional regulator
MTRRPPPDPQALLPLSPPVFHILLALGDGEKHGYAIMSEIADRTGGGVRILPGTLYSTIKRMLPLDLIVECARPDEADSDDERRRYYRITAFGRAVAAAEAARMAMLVRVAQKKSLAPGR